MRLAVDGQGGLSNWTLPFPIPAVVKGNNANFSHYAIGKGVDATGYDKPYTYGPDSPWQQNSTWKMSAFVGGNNETHTATPTSSTTLNGNTMVAAAAAIQQANPTLLPVLAVGGIQFGAAPGSPTPAAVGAANQLVDLFNSQASRSLPGAAQGQQEQQDREGGDAVAKRRARPCRSGERGEESGDHRRPRRQSSSRA